MRVISLGWGVQSFTLAVMAALGDMEPVDAAVHSDTRWEREATYAFAARWTPWLEAHGVRVVTVRAEDTSPVVPLPNGHSKIMIPAFSGDGGMIRRQCTHDWKIAPLRKWVSSVCGREATTTDVLLGISCDESERIRPADVRYIRHVWPLIEKRMTRAACERYLAQRGVEIPPKSSCVFCPFQSGQRLARMARAGGRDWQIAVEIDEAIRTARPPALYVSSKLIPLRDIGKAAQAQTEIFGEECLGYCGV